MRLDLTPISCINESCLVGLVFIRVFAPFSWSVFMYYDYFPLTRKVFISNICQQGAITPSQSGRRSEGNEGMLLHSPNLQHYKNLTIRLFSVVPRRLIGGSCPSAEVQSVYSRATAAWATRFLSYWMK